MNKIFIEEKKILNNFKTLQKHKPYYHIFPVLKSNAYGHGLEQITKILSKIDDKKIKYLCVDSFPEYQIVRDFSKKQILLIGETYYKNYKYFDYKRTTFCIYNLESIHFLGKLSKKRRYTKKKIKIHLFLNTGMNREWIKNEELINILETLKKYPNLEVEGVMSHFHSAEEISTPEWQESKQESNQESANEQQIKLFREMIYEINNYGHSPQYKHISASAGFFTNDDPLFNSARIGIALYGYSPFTDKLQPALRITSRIISKQIIQKKEGVSYNHTFINQTENCHIATLPFWYAEWLPRSASNKIVFQHQSKRKKREEIKQIGNICMNLCSILTKNECSIYDEIEIIWTNTKNKNTVSELAKQTNTIPYEILVKLDKGIRREII